MVDAEILGARRRACKKLRYETTSRGGFVFGKTTAAALVGLTPTRLERLIEPCEFAFNPHYKSGPLVGLYDPVQLVRLTRRKSVREVVAELTAKRASRQAASRKAVETKRQKALDEFEEDIESSDWTTHWPSSRGELLERAVDAYNDLHRSRGRYEKYATGDESMEFLSRIAVNYLRHERTEYEWLLEKFTGRVGIDEVHATLKERIESLAHARYPGLAICDYDEAGDNATAEMHESPVLAADSREGSDGLTLDTDITGAVEPIPPSALHSRVSEEDAKASGQ